MNFLGHLFLSHGSDELMIGNFIADAIKGNRHENFPPEIQRGILMHRAIDHFTDTHPMARKTALRFRPRFSKYAPVLVDVVYDHFLAANWPSHHNIPLADFTESAYALMQKNIHFIPEKTALMLSHMAKQNWLLSYAKIEGIERALQGMSRRTKHPTSLYLAIEELQQQYEEIKMEWENFFTDAKMEFSKYHT